MEVCVRCVVSGRVQGVWFRASTREQAERLGIRGYANNRPDGRVEVLACGEQAAVDRLRDWLWQGPPNAYVTDVRCDTVAAPKALTGFGTG
jgi:acylphosphatase